MSDRVSVTEVREYQLLLSNHPLMRQMAQFTVRGGSNEAQMMITCYDVQGSDSVEFDIDLGDLTTGSHGGLQAYVENRLRTTGLFRLPTLFSLDAVEGGFGVNLVKKVFAANEIGMTMSEGVWLVDLISLLKAFAELGKTIDSVHLQLVQSGLFRGNHTHDALINMGLLCRCIGDDLSAIPALNNKLVWGQLPIELAAMIYSRDSVAMLVNYYTSLKLMQKFAEQKTVSPIQV